MPQPSPLRPVGLARVLALALSAVLLSTCGGGATPEHDAAGNLLAGLTPTRADGARNVDRLADGVASQEGDFWDSDVTARLNSRRSFVEFDLGSPRPLRCALVQGDNNDYYRFEGSLDGQTWTSIYEGPPVGGAGLRTRQGHIEATARYVRLSADGGDGLYSIGEAAIYGTCPSPWPPELIRIHGTPLEDSASRSVFLFALALTAFVLLSRKGGGRLRQLTVLLPLLA